MRMIHDNFGSLSVNALELTLAVQNDEELNKVLPCVKIA